MFFSADVLKPCGGKFAVVWLLGNAPFRARRGHDRTTVARVSRSDILKSDVAKLCREIAERLPVSSPGHLALRMAVTLYVGTATCHAKQIKILLAEIRSFGLTRKKASGRRGIDCEGFAHGDEVDNLGDEAGAHEPVAISGRRGRGSKRRRGADAVTMAEVDLQDVVEAAPELGRFSVPAEQITLREGPDGDPFLVEDDGGFGDERMNAGATELGIFAPEGEEPQVRKDDVETELEGATVQDVDFEPMPQTGEPQLEREDEANGTKRHGEAHTNQPGAPKRPRSPPRTDQMEETMEEGKADNENKKKKRKRTQDVQETPPPPFPDFAEEEDAPPRAPADGTIPEGSPLPTADTPTSSAAKTKPKRKKRNNKYPIVDKVKELGRKDFEKSVASAQDLCHDSPLLCSPRKVRFEADLKDWLKDSTRKTRSHPLADHLKEKMMALANQPQELVSEAEEEQAAEVEEPVERALLREGSALHEHPSSLMGENSRLRSISGMSAGLAEADSANLGAHMHSPPPHGVPLPDDEEDNNELRTIVEEQPPDLDVSAVQFAKPEDPRLSAVKQPPDGVVTSSQASEVSTTCGILSLASSDAAVVDDLVERIETLTESGRYDIEFSKLAEGLGGRRAVALAFNNLLHLEMEGKVEAKQEEVFGQIKISYFLNL